MTADDGAPRVRAEDAKRHTGRTTRMLAHAKRLADEGRAVYVVFHLVSQFPREPIPGVKFETTASLGPSLDLDAMRLRGAHPNCVLLVDHHVIEVRYGAVLDMWTAYDLAPGGGICGAHGPFEMTCPVCDEEEAASCAAFDKAGKEGP